MRVRHCIACGGDGIDPLVKTEDGEVARGEKRLLCETCKGDGHVVVDEDIDPPDYDEKAVRMGVGF